MRAHSAAPGGGTPGHGRINGNGQHYTRLTRQQISDLELRKAGVHEAAHAVVAWHLGYLTGQAEVFRVEDPGEWDKTWSGRVRFYEHIKGQDGRFIGLAGIVAEHVECDPDVTDMLLVDYLESDVIGLSATDAQMASGYTPRDIADTLTLVRWCWEEIDTRAAYLVRRGTQG